MKVMELLEKGITARRSSSRRPRRACATAWRLTRPLVPDHTIAAGNLTGYRARSRLPRDHGRTRLLATPNISARPAGRRPHICDLNDVGGVSAIIGELGRLGTF